MAVEYIFVGSVFTFVLAFTFNILGMHETESLVRRMFYLLFGMVAIFLCGALLLSTDVAMMIPIAYFFWGIGLIEFVLVIVFALKALDLTKKRNRGWAFEEN